MLVGFDGRVVFRNGPRSQKKDELFSRAKILFLGQSIKGACMFHLPDGSEQIMATCTVSRNFKPNCELRS